MNKILLPILTVAGFAAIIFLLAIFSGFTISTLWGWFVAPLGVKAISYANAYGLAILVNVFTGVRLSNEDSTKDMVVKGIILNLAALSLGFIAVQFM